MNNIIDCTGLACPLPVMRCRDFLKIARVNFLCVVVDNQAARDNVVRFLTTQKYSVSVDAQQGKWHINATAQEMEVPLALEVEHGEDTAVKQTQIEQRKIVVLLTSDVIGTGDANLGKKLMQAFLKTLPEMGQELWRIVLLNSGVYLASKGHEALESLQNLEQSGVDILVCGTCLEYYKLLETKAVGQTTNMLDVVTSLQLASLVIRP